MRYVLRLVPISADYVSLILLLTGCGSHEMATDSDPGHDDTDTPFEVRIEIKRDVYQGHHCFVDVYMDRADERFGAFDLMIAYDASALTLANIFEGDIYDCGWEYMAWQSHPEDCFVEAHGRIIRVNGIANIDDGPNQSDLDCTDAIPRPFTLFTLDFLVSNDRTIEGTWLPIRFYWCDCDDNVIGFGASSDSYRAISGVSRYVFDYDTPDLGDYIEDPANGFPSYAGVQEECFGSSDVIRYVDFMNGGIDIIMADSIDAPGCKVGDFDLDGIAHTFSDLIIFRDYFIYGRDSLGDYYNCVHRMDDINGDGKRLTVADLQYQSRIFAGDALPTDSLPLDSAEARVASDGVISVDHPMGAAAIRVIGEVTPVLLADSMQMIYAYDGATTNVLVHSLFSDHTFRGAFVQLPGVLPYVRLATPEGVLCDSVVFVEDSH